MKKKNQNPSIAISVVKEGVQAEKKLFDHKAYLGVSAQVAQSDIYCRNWKFKNAEKHFPTEPLLRTCDKWFPYAQGGPLFVDEPEGDVEISQCLRKAQFLKQEGHRYVYITKEMKATEVREQLLEYNPQPKGAA